MFDEPINHAAARLALDGFATWSPPDPAEDLAAWVLARLARATWSSTEQAVLELAAGLLGIDTYAAATYDNEGAPMTEPRSIPPLGSILSVSFDPSRRAHVLAALELAVIGEYPMEWHWITTVAETDQA